jgi:hypothetical protein
MAPYSYFSNTFKRDFCGDAISYTCFILVLLHIYWFHLIVLMVVKFATAGNVKGDIREEGQNYEDSTEQTNEKQTKKSVKKDGKVIPEHSPVNGASENELTRRVTRSSSNKKK